MTKEQMTKTVEVAEKETPFSGCDATIRTDEYREFVCTRCGSHEGQHVAMGLDPDTIYAVWE